MTEYTSEISFFYEKTRELLRIERTNETPELTPINNDFLSKVITKAKEEHGEIRQLLLIGLLFDHEFYCSELIDIEALTCDACVFQSFDYSFVGFELLQLNECRFGFFISKSIRSSGHLNISNCIVTGATDNLKTEVPFALVDIRNAYVQGHISISNLEFSNEIEHSVPVIGLSVDASTVDGRVKLNKIKSARSIKLNGLKVGYGFRLSDSNFQYGATFKDITSNSGFEIENSRFGWQVFLRNVTVKGDVTIKKCEVSKEQGKALSLANVQVSGSLFIQECQLLGQCFLHTISTDMNADIAKNRLLRNDNDDVELLRLVSSRIGGFVIVKENHIHGAVHFWRLNTNAKLSFKENFCRSASKLTTSLNTRNAFTVKNCIVGDDLEIVNSEFDGGVCTFGSTVKGRLDFSENRFTMSGVKVAAPSNKIVGIARTIQFLMGKEVTESINHTFGILGGCTQNLDLSDMRIQGNLDISKFTQDEGVRVYVRLDNTSCRTLSDGNFNEVTGLPPFVSYESLSVKTVDDTIPVREIRKKIERMFKYGRRGNYLPTGPQPFAHLARLLYARGDQELADFATLNMKRALTRQSSSVFRRVSGRIFDLTFGYGLSKTKALASLSAWVLLGTFGVQFAQERQVLVIDVVRVVDVESEPHLRFSNEFSEVRSTSKMRLCDQDIVPPLYAFELMVPIVDLGQERQCSLLTSPQSNAVTDLELKKWWAAKYIYTLIGWLIISISIVTFSGAIRLKDN